MLHYMVAELKGDFVGSASGAKNLEYYIDVRIVQIFLKIILIDLILF